MNLNPLTCKRKFARVGGVRGALMLVDVHAQRTPAWFAAGSSPRQWVADGVPKSEVAPPTGDRVDYLVQVPC